MEDKKVSKYQMVESYIVEGIQSNHYKVNDILPTEAELAEKFNCSRVTVRQALSNLAYKGIIYRIQGKGSSKGSKEEGCSGSVGRLWMGQIYRPGRRCRYHEGLWCQRTCGTAV